MQIDELAPGAEPIRSQASPADSGLLPASSLQPTPGEGKVGAASGVRSHRLLGVGLVVLAALCWSTSGVFITQILQGGGIAPLSLAFWRVLATFTCLFVTLLAFRRDLLRVARRDLPWLAGMGALAMGTFQVLWILSVLYNGLSIATVIQCNAPVIVTLMAWLIWREALTWRKWVAIAMAAVGTVLVSGLTRSSDVQLSALGLLIALSSALGYAGITLFAKKLTGLPGAHGSGGSGYNPWTILMYCFGFAALALLPFQFGRPLPSPANWQAYGSFAALVLIPTIAGYTLYTMGLRRLQASIASITAMSEVPFAAFNGYVFLGERLDALQAMGALIVMGGVAILSWQPKRPDQPPEAGQNDIAAFPPPAAGE
jgi:drug/metabolite transporter, DME family